MEYEVLDSYDDDGGAKVVAVLARVQGAAGETAEAHYLTWGAAERYKVDPSGKQVPKTGTDYKREIDEQLEAYYAPKAHSPCQ